MNSKTYNSSSTSTTNNNENKSNNNNKLNLFNNIIEKMNNEELIEIYSKSEKDIQLKILEEGNVLKKFQNYISDKDWNKIEKIIPIQKIDPPLKYSKKDKIGEGGSGMVYSINDKNGNKVALKKMESNEKDPMKQISRLQRELLLTRYNLVTKYFFKQIKMNNFYIII